MASMGPVFFDIFGLIAFIILMYIGIKLLKDKRVPPLMSGAVIAIAAAGLIIDGFFVIKTYFGG